MKTLENNITSKTHSKNNSVFFQPKLAINNPDDQYEREADEMADRVMRMPIDKNANTFFKSANNITSIQRKCAECEEEEEKLQRKENSNGEVEAGNELQNYVGGLNSGGNVLPNNVRSFFEPRFGYDFSNVRIHNDSVATKSAQSINALAYTSGNNIVFNQNKYSPESDSGKRLLGHELTHVVQQNSSIQAKIIQCEEDDTEAERVKKLYDDYYEATGGNPDWNRAAILLNGFNDDDIKKLLKKLSSPKRFQLRNAAVNQGIKKIADFILAIDEAERVQKLYDDYNRATGKNPDWNQAAILLNGFSDYDIKRLLNDKKMSEDKRFQLRNAAVNQGIKRIADFILTIDKTSEANRVNKLIKDYRKAITDNKLDNAVMYLNAFNITDIDTYLTEIDSHKRRLLRESAAKNGYERIVTAIELFEFTETTKPKSHPDLGANNLDMMIRSALCLKNLKKPMNYFTQIWISNVCERNRVDFLQTREFDAFGHCWVSCEGSRACGIQATFIGGTLYEVFREIQRIKRISPHDSFPQDLANQKLGRTLSQTQGTCYDLCDNAHKRGTLDLSAPVRECVVCATKKGGPCSP